MNTAASVALHYDAADRDEFEALVDFLLDRGITPAIELGGDPPDSAPDGETTDQVVPANFAERFESLVRGKPYAEARLRRLRDGLIEIGFRPFTPESLSAYVSFHDPADLGSPNLGNLTSTRFYFMRSVDTEALEELGLTRNGRRNFSVDLRDDAAVDTVLAAARHLKR